MGKKKKSDKLEKDVENKVVRINNESTVISILGFIGNSVLLGFTSLLKFDRDERRYLTPWDATMYVKKEYRNKGYSRILNNAIITKSKELRYNKIYLKSDLINYYKKFGDNYIGKLENGEKLNCIEIR